MLLLAIALSLPVGLVYSADAGEPAGVRERMSDGIFKQRGEGNSLQGCYTGYCYVYFAPEDADKTAPISLEQMKIGLAAIEVAGKFALSKKKNPIARLFHYSKSREEQARLLTQSIVTFVSKNMSRLTSVTVKARIGDTVTEVIVPYVELTREEANRSYLGNLYSKCIKYLLGISKRGETLTF